MTGKWCIPNNHKNTLRRIKLSRYVRKSLRNLKGKFSRDNSGTPSSLIKAPSLVSSSYNRERKYKSTLAIAVAGTAIGVSHVAAVSGKYRKDISGKSTLGIGIVVGVITSGIWYKYVDAAYDGVSEDDISMMFEMANSTGYGSLEDDDDNAKAVDILHSIVTGKTSESSSSSKSMFKYDDEDDDEETEVDTDSSIFGKKVSFSDGESKSTSGIGIGRSLFKGSDSVRKSFLPDLDRQEAEDKSEAREGWLVIE